MACLLLKIEIQPIRLWAAAYAIGFDLEQMNEYQKLNISIERVTREKRKKKQQKILSSHRLQCISLGFLRFGAEKKNGQMKLGISRLLMSELTYK